eukprot:tig00020723_g13469.t1
MQADGGWATMLPKSGVVYKRTGLGLRKRTLTVSADEILYGKPNSSKVRTYALPDPQQGARWVRSLPGAHGSKRGFEVHVPGRSLALFACSAEERDAWLAALRAAGFRDLQDGSVPPPVAPCSLTAAGSGGRELPSTPEDSPRCGAAAAAAFEGPFFDGDAPGPLPTGPALFRLPRAPAWDLPLPHRRPAGPAASPRSLSSGAALAAALRDSGVRSAPPRPPAPPRAPGAARRGAAARVELRALAEYACEHVARLAAPAPPSVSRSPTSPAPASAAPQTASARPPARPVPSPDPPSRAAGAAAVAGEGDGGAPPQALGRSWPGTLDDETVFGVAAAARSFVQRAAALLEGWEPGAGEGAAEPAAPERPRGVAWPGSPKGAWRGAAGAATAAAAGPAAQAVFAVQAAGALVEGLQAAARGSGAALAECFARGGPLAAADALLARLEAADREPAARPEAAYARAALRDLAALAVEAARGAPARTPLPRLGPPHARPPPRLRLRRLTRGLTGAEGGAGLALVPPGVLLDCLLLRAGPDAPCGVLLEAVRAAAAARRDWYAAARLWRALLERGRAREADRLLVEGGASLARLAVGSPLGPWLAGRLRLLAASAPEPELAASALRRLGSLARSAAAAAAAAGSHSARGAGPGPWGPAALLAAAARAVTSLACHPEPARRRAARAVLGSFALPSTAPGPAPDAAACTEESAQAASAVLRAARARLLREGPPPPSDDEDADGACARTSVGRAMPLPPPRRRGAAEEASFAVRGSLQHPRLLPPAESGAEGSDSSRVFDAVPLTPAARPGLSDAEADPESPPPSSEAKPRLAKRLHAHLEGASRRCLAARPCACCTSADVATFLDEVVGIDVEWPPMTPPPEPPVFSPARPKLKPAAAGWAEPRPWEKGACPRRADDRLYM